MTAPGLDQVAFDMDGTLVDTEHVHFDAWNDVFVKLFGLGERFSLLAHPPRACHRPVPAAHPAARDISPSTQPITGARNARNPLHCVCILTVLSRPLLPVQLPRHCTAVTATSRCVLLTVSARPFLPLGGVFAVGTGPYPAEWFDKWVGKSAPSVAAQFATAANAICCTFSIRTLVRCFNRDGGTAD